MQKIGVTFGVTFELGVTEKTVKKEGKIRDMAVFKAF